LTTAMKANNCGLSKLIVFHRSVKVIYCIYTIAGCGVQLENADCLATIKITGKDNCRLILFDSLGSPLAIQCFGMVRNGCTHCVLCFSELFKLAPRLLLRAMRSFLLRRWPGADLRASRFLRWPFLPIR